MKEIYTAGRLRWGIIGAGHIAREFADGVGELAELPKLLDVLEKRSNLE